MPNPNQDLINQYKHLLEPQKLQGTGGPDQVTESKVGMEASSRNAQVDLASKDTLPVTQTDPDFVPRTKGYLDDKLEARFSGTPRTDDFWTNAKLDGQEVLDGTVALGKALFEDVKNRDFKTVKTIAENFVPAMVDSYTRWYDAWEEGTFTEAVKRYPVQFAQDMAAPLSLTLSGGAAVATKLGKNSIKAAKVGKVLGALERVADTAGMVVDPVGTGVTLGAKGVAKATGKIGGAVIDVAKTRKKLTEFETRVSKRNDDFHGVPIVSVDDVSDKAPLSQRVDQGLSTVQTAIFDANYPIRKFASEAEAEIKTGKKITNRSKGPLVGAGVGATVGGIAGSAVPGIGTAGGATAGAAVGSFVGGLFDKSAATFTNTPLEVQTRLLGGLDSTIESTVNKGFKTSAKFLKPASDSLPPAGSFEGPGLREIYENLGSADMKTLSAYSVARRALYDLDPKGAKTGVSSKAAAELIRKYDPDVNKNARGVAQFNMANDPEFRDSALKQTEQMNKFSQETGEGVQYNPLDVAESVVKENGMHMDSAGDVDIHNAWKGLKKFHEDRIEYYVQGGMISRDMANAWKTENPNYVPFMRTESIRIPVPEDLKAEIGEGFLDFELKDNKYKVSSSSGNKLKNPQQIVKRFKGSLRAIMDPVASDTILTAKMMREVELNQVMQEAHALAVRGSSKVRVIDPPKDVYDAAKQASTPEEFQKSMDAQGIFKELASGQDPLLAVDSKLINPKGLPNNVGIYHKNGEKIFLEFDDPDVLSLLGQMGVKGTSKLANVLTKPFRSASQLQRTGITSDPSFIGRNIIKDATSATIFSNTGFKPFYDNMRGIYHLNKKSGEVFDIWANSGGMNSFVTEIDKPGIAKRLKKYASETDKDYLKSIGGTVLHPLQAMQFYGSKILPTLQKVSDQVESSTRLGDFNRGLRQALNVPGNADDATIRKAFDKASPEQIQKIKLHALASRDISTDYNMRGGSEVVRALSSISTFMSAQLAGTDNFRRKFYTGNPKERIRLASKATAMLTVPSLVLYGINQRTEGYDDIPETEKDLFFHVPIPREVKDFGIPGYNGLRIPVPFDLGLAFMSLPRKITQAMGEESPEAFTDFLKDYGNNMYPSAMPTLLKPVVENATNYDFFFKGPVEPRNQAQLVKSERYTSNTSELGKVMSKWSEWAAGAGVGAAVGAVAGGLVGSAGKGAAVGSAVGAAVGGSSKPKSLHLSPIEWDNLMFDIGGTLTKSTIRAFDNPIRRTRDNESAIPEFNRPGRSNPLLSGFIANSSGRSKMRDEYHDIKSRVTEISKTYKSFDKLQEKGAREKFAKENELELKGAVIMNQTGRKISSLMKQKRIVRASPKMTAQEKGDKIDQIDSRITSESRTAVQLYKKLYRKDNNQ